jgi:hypothetical protein
MLYLADTAQRRGRLFHSELNQPVYGALQNLSSAVSVSPYFKPLFIRAVLMSRADIWSRPHFKKPHSEKQYHPHLNHRQCHCQSTKRLGQQPELPRQERDFELVGLKAI